MQISYGQTQTQNQTQQQTLKMSPQMQEKMKFLFMPILELREKTATAFDDFPALDIEGGMEHDSGEEAQKKSDKKQQFLEGTVARRETLQEHLLVQLGVQKNVDQSIIDTAKLLVQNLNKDGFHIVPPQEVAKNASPETLQKAIKLVQMMDPIGTCTANSKESLEVQTSLREDAPEYTGKVIAEYLDALDKGKYREIAKSLNITEDQVLEILEFIKKLDPAPGSRFNNQPTQWVLPEFKLKIIDNEPVVYLQNQIIPPYQISKEYEDKADSQDADRKFYQDQVQEARDFISMIEDRKSNLLKTAKALVEYQKEFFLKGPKYRRPITQKDFAEQMGVSDSTISRFANTHYLQTDQGIIPFSYFFPTQGEIDMEAIKEILESHKDEKLSDQQISDMLKEEGISMARRTVSKYRSLIKSGGKYEF